MKKGHSYTYNPDLMEDRGDMEKQIEVNRGSRTSCCACGEKDIARYSFLVGFLFSVLTGPYSGAQFVAGTQETDFYITAASTLVLFIFSLLMTVCNSKRIIMRLWFLVGCVWCVVGYVIYFRKDFTEKPVEWLYIASIQTGIFALCSLRLIFTDPWTISVLG